MKISPFVYVLTAAVAATSLAACGGGSGNETVEPEGGGFESDDPSGQVGGPDRGMAGPTAAGAGGATSDASGELGGDAARAIEEADIIQIAADRLYAVSRYGGLSIIDVANPDRLDLLGRLKVEAEPFELYVRDGVVFLMVSDWGRYVEEGGGWSWVQSSNLLSIDTSNPSAPSILGDFAIPGRISDSRIVGDVLYVVAHEDGYCWGCEEEKPRTTIASLDVSEPRAVSEVDHLAFSDVNDQWGWGPRSVTVTTDRLYVGGREYSETGRQGSTIRVVDISDPAGDMVLGATVEAEGEIVSRWQMDEHQGVLRVVSQPPVWRSDLPPVVQTFTVESADVVTPLGRLEMVLPRPEQLQSVRFDGPRGYAVTFERTDPLFTLDLTDPAQPRQLGELEIPGFVYHMEPRGDRLIGLGFDQGNAEGAITVSIFDVSDLSAPTMLDRVNFGGNWAHLPEDQNRIHKAFRILDAEGLIVVPFSGYEETGNAEMCGGRYRSGVQLVDIAGDVLGLRGLAETRGEARRGLLHRERLLTVSDDRVQAFDVTNRDNPTQTSQASLARRVSQALPIGDNLVRLGQDWWTESAEIDVVPLSDASAPEGLGTIDVESAASGGSCGYSFWGAELFNQGDTAFIVYRDWDYQEENERFLLAAVDVSNPASPRIISNETMGSGAQDYFYDGGYLVRAGSQITMAGSAIVTQHREGTWDTRDGEFQSRGAWLDIIDVSDPASPRTTRFDLPFEQGLGGLIADGTTVLTSHYESSGDGRVRFYVDRIDVSDPGAPRLTESVNVPGSLFGWDAASSRAITVDYRHDVRTRITSQECWESSSYRAIFEPDTTDQYGGYDQNTTGTCTRVLYSLRLVRISDGVATLEATHALDEQADIGPSAMGDGRLFLSLAPGYFYGGPVAVDCFDFCGYGPGSGEPAELTVVSGFRQGRLDVETLSLGDKSSGSVSQLVASGHRALAATWNQGDLIVVDADDAASPRVARTVDIIGYAENMTASGSNAIVSLGFDGVEVVPFGD